MPSYELVLIGFGALVGLASSVLFDWIRRAWDRWQRRRRGRKLLVALFQEAEEGIARCEGLAKAARKGSVSFSRVYVSMWESMRLELWQCLEDVEILRLLDSIYRRFDLVNFNMQREAFAVGAAFAAEYLPEMHENLSKLQTEIEGEA